MDFFEFSFGMLMFVLFIFLVVMGFISLFAGVFLKALGYFAGAVVVRWFI